MEEAMKFWSELQPYRNERRRCKNYTYGDQWKDIVTVEGRRITEEQYIREQGSAPLKNNLIRKIVRNILGVFRNNYSIPTLGDALLNPEAYTPELDRAYADMVKHNRLSEVYSRVMEEYLIGGLAVVKKRLTRLEEGGVITSPVRPESFFFNTDAVDPRGLDIHTIGEIHTLKGCDMARIFPGSERRYGDDPSAEHRIVEIWRRDGNGWSYRFVDSDGETLRGGRSPLPGATHPYVMKAYPFIDGEIHSFVADCIDQQRYINRLITLNDWVIRASAKGVLLFPEGAIPDDLELDDIAAQWSRYNGVIRYKAKAGMPGPQQVSTTTGNVGISQLLEVQLRMMEDVSGVNDALQGQLSSGAVSGTLYRQQTRQALTGLTDILEGFRAFMLESARKDLTFLTMF